MAPPRATRLCFLALLCASAVHPQETSGGAPNSLLEFVERLFFGGLVSAGCLPDDFRMEDMTACAEEGKIDDPAVYKALTCVAKTMSAGADPAAYKRAIDYMSSDSSWRSVQKKSIDHCMTLVNPAVLTTPGQQGTFVLACSRKSRKHRCRLDLMKRFTVALGLERLVEKMQYLVQVSDGGCLDIFANERTDKAIASCYEGSGLNLATIKAGVDWVRDYTRYVSEGGSSDSVAPLSQEDVVAVSNQLDIFEKVSVCAMRARGEIDDDEVVNYAALQNTVASSGARAELKYLLAAEIDRCKKQGLTNAKGFLACYHKALPLACETLQAEDLVIFEGRGA